MAGLLMELSIINTTDLPLPFGLGFHPWLVRTPLTRLTAEMGAAWLEDTQHSCTRRPGKKVSSVLNQSLIRLMLSGFPVANSKWHAFAPTGSSLSAWADFDVVMRNF